MEFLRKLRADLEAFFSRLAPRERVMVSAAGFAIAAFIVLMISTGVSRSISAREGRIEDKTQLLAQVGKLTQGFRAAEAERQQLEDRLRSGNVQLMSFISQVGNRLGIAVDDLRPGTPGGTDKIKEDSVEVNLQKIDLAKLAHLLEELERGPGVVKVRRLNLRTRGDDPNTLDVTLLVATYSLKG